MPKKVCVTKKKKQNREVMSENGREKITHQINQTIPDSESDSEPDRLSANSASIMTDGNESRS